jgi:hypothetical protein
LLAIGGAIALAAMAAAPVVIPAATALWGPGPSFGHTPGFFPTVAWALGPLVIIAVLGMLLWYRNARLIEWYLLCWGFALVLGALLVVFPANNQYKFVYLASQPLGLLAAWGIQQWSKTARRPWGATVVAGLVIGLVLLNTVVCSISYVGQARRATLPSTVPVESEGTRVDITTSLENYRDAYAWVREHTAPDALFVEAPQDNARRLFPLITQRMLYVSAFNLSYMFQESPEFEARWQMAELLFTPSIPKQDALAQVATAAPEIYLLLESDALLENYTPLKEEFDRMEQLKLVFDNPNVKIYRFEHQDERSSGTGIGGLSEATLVAVLT